ncbi:DUF4174 domain-containing protein [Halopseudomonas sp.]|jgi:hypothetical protein|uniref:DUF4174 domain-containing protein n=1 Tax=Halopseudomonas sp. TaxID=2901191 RepID=UPI0039E3D0AD
MRSTYEVRRSHVLLTLMLSLVVLTAYGADMNRLSDYQWKNRVILVQAESGDTNALDILQQAQPELDARDIAWFVKTGSELVSNQNAVSSSLESDITDVLADNPPEERVLLIGKDGGIKSRESSLDLEAIFSRIDSMPMRVREMRND